MARCSIWAKFRSEVLNPIPLSLRFSAFICVLILYHPTNEPHYPSGSYGIVPVGTQDFRPILSRLKNLDPSPQAIYFGGVVTEAALLRLQMTEMGMDDYLYAGVTGFDSETFNKTAGLIEEVLVTGKCGYLEKLRE